VYGDPYTITLDEINYGITPDNHVFLSTGVSPTGSGAVTTTPDSLGRYTAGQKVSLKAIPAEGWDFAGWAGDTSGLTNPLAVTLGGDRAIRARFLARKGTSLLLNGKFSDSLNGWAFSAWETNAKAAATVEGADSILHVAVTGLGPDPWGVQLTQGLVLDSGTTYIVSGDLRGEVGNIVTYAVGESSGKYRKIFSGADTFTTTAVRTFVDTFIDTLPSASALRLEFSVGAKLGNVYLDNLKIARISGTDLPSHAARNLGAAGRTWSFRRIGNGLRWVSTQSTAAGDAIQLSTLDGRLLGSFALQPGSRSGTITLGDLSGATIARVPGSTTGIVILAP